MLVQLLEKSEGFRRFYIKLLYFPSFGKKVIIFNDEHDDISDNKNDVKTETVTKDEDERVSVCDDDDDIPNILL